MRESVVGYALILVLLTVVLMVIAAMAISSAEQYQDSVFPADVLADVHGCMDNTTSTYYKSTTVNINADGMIHCLYNAGYSLSLHGDPIIAPTPQEGV